MSAGRPVGKPRRRPESASLCRVVVLVTEAEREELRALAKWSGVSVGEYVRRAALGVTSGVTSAKKGKASA